MKSTENERTDINIRLTEIQTILENNLYEDTAEEQELLGERKELLHELKSSELLDHFTKLIESDNKRFSLKLATGGEDATIEVFDKKQNISYVIKIKPIECSKNNDQDHPKMISVNDKEYGLRRLKRKVSRLKKKLDKLNKIDALSVYGAEDLGRVQEAIYIYEDLIDIWEN